uniref:Amino acid transporter n=1 Tax=Macrostomum lignano TaxID=282301 RepID=A0A1I8FJA7_9PLAT
MLVVALIFAWETAAFSWRRSTTPRPSESVCTTPQVMGLIGVALLFVLPDSGQNLRVILLAACIILCATTTLLPGIRSKVLPAGEVRAGSC